jgi:RNA polymerase sigma factor (sigma-70 family)
MPSSTEKEGRRFTNKACENVRERKLRHATAEHSGDQEQGEGHPYLTETAREYNPHMLDDVGAYLKKVGTYPLMSTEKVTEVAERIEASRKKAVAEIIESPKATELLVSWYEPLKKGEMKISSIINLNIACSEYPVTSDDKDNNISDGEKPENVMGDSHMTEKAEQIRPQLLDTLGRIKDLHVEMEQTRNKRLNAFLEGKAPDALTEKKYNRSKALMAEMATSLCLKTSCVERLVREHEEISEEFAGIEETMIRKAGKYSIKPEEFLERFYGSGMDHNWLQKTARKNSRWKKLARNDYKEIASITDQLILKSHKAGLVPADIYRISERSSAALGETKKAIQELVNGNLRLVVHCAKKLHDPKGKMSFLDIVQEGNIGLHLAAEQFNYRHGIPFGTYAGKSIAGEIIRAFPKQGFTIRLPAHVYQLQSTLASAIREFTQTNDKKPSTEELSEYFGISREQVEQTLISFKSTCSINMPVVNSDGDEKSFQDMLEDPKAPDPEKILEENLLGGYLNRLIEESDLTGQEKEIIRKRYLGENENVSTLQEIGEKMGLTRERIRQIESKALVKLRKIIAKSPNDYLAFDEQFGKGKFSDNNPPVKILKKKDARTTCPPDKTKKQEEKKNFTACKKPPVKTIDDFNLCAMENLHKHPVISGEGIMKNGEPLVVVDKNKKPKGILIPVSDLKKLRKENPELTETRKPLKTIRTAFRIMAQQIGDNEAYVLGEKSAPEIAFLSNKWIDTVAGTVSNKSLTGSHDPKNIAASHVFNACEL